jgi:transposase
MKLYGNAALSWSGRRRLAERVVVEGWMLRAAAGAAGVSVRCAGKWVRRYRSEGELGLRDRSSAPRRVANRTPVERVEAIVALRHLRMTAAEIAELLGMALSTVSGILTRHGVGRLGRLGLEPALALRALPSWRAAAHRRQEARPDRARRRQTLARRRLSALHRHLHRRRWTHPSKDRLGIRAHRRRRLQPLRLRRGAPRRESDDRCRLPPSRRRLLRTPPDHDRTRADRQRRLLPRNRPRTRLHSPRHPPPPHPSLPAANKRQSRAASSAPCSTAGPTAPSTAQAANAPKHLTAGSGTTTINANTQRSATNHRSAEPTCSGLTARARAPGDPARQRVLARRVRRRDPGSRGPSSRMR